MGFLIHGPGGAVKLYSSVPVGMYTVLAMAYRLTAIEKCETVVWFSCAKLTGSMFCLCIFSSIFSIDGRS